MQKCKYDKYIVMARKRGSGKKEQNTLKFGTGTGSET